MTDIQPRLSRCFLSVFPGLTAAEAQGANQAALSQWDSLAHVTLLAAISEEFQIDLDDDSFESLTSYPSILSFVETQVGQND